MDLLVGTFVLRPYVFAFLAVFIAAGVADLGWRRTLAFTASGSMTTSSAIMSTPVAIAIPQRGTARPASANRARQNAA